MVFIVGQMGESMKVNGKMVNNTDMVNIFYQMVLKDQGYGKMVKE